MEEEVPEPPCKKIHCAGEEEEEEEEEEGEDNDDNDVDTHSSEDNTHTQQ